MKGSYKNLFYPPGGILLWIIITLELITFAAAIIIMMVYSRDEPMVFHQSRLELNTVMGTFNTCILLTSGYFMAEAVKKQELNDRAGISFHLRLTLLLGFLFILIKSIEYYQKWVEGFEFSTNMFFSFYWSLTVFHLAHVLTGIVILLYFATRIKHRKPVDPSDFKSAATFWHLCDLIWLMIFPSLYLLF